MHHARRAVAALQRVVLVEGVLDGVEHAVRASPSIVVTSAPSAWTASSVHDLTDSPSSSTVQAPHEDVSQPTFGARSGEPLAQEVDEQLARLDLEPRAGCR